MMQQPIQDRRRDQRVAKDFSPRPEAVVRGEDNGASLIPPGDELEEEVGAVLIKRDVADLIDDQQRRQGIRLEAFLQPVLGRRVGARAMRLMAEVNRVREPW